MNNAEITVTVNGVRRDGSVEPRTLLSDFLRHGLRLTGTHVGCEQGGCGSCTVLVNGEAVRSCLMLAIQVDGQEVTTVEGLGDGPGLGAVQEAMLAEHGLQCGFCTPGILMSLTAAERDGLSVEEAIGEVLPGHICRCTGYRGIRAAIRRRWSDLEGAR